MVYRRYRKQGGRRAEPASLKEVIDQMLDTYKLRGKLSEASLMESWGRIMGNTIARRTKALFIKDRKLFVKLSSAPLKHELSMAKPRILELLHKDLKEKVVDEVVFL